MRSIHFNFIRFASKKINGINKYIPTSIFIVHRDPFIAEILFSLKTPGNVGAKKFAKMLLKNIYRNVSFEKINSDEF